jgi:rhodanese-related sulfurtransferase
MLTLKVIFEKGTGQILGAQAFGQDGTEKRIDVLATAIAGKMSVKELTDLDLCYAPPYSSANDPVNMAGFVATNILEGFTQSISAQDFLKIYNTQTDEVGAKHSPAITVLDVRNEDEVNAGALVGSVNIPLPQLRERLQSLDKNSSIYIHCAVGFRGHLAYRILSQNGFNKVKNVSGGYYSIELFKN